MSVLLDTAVFIEYLRGYASAREYLRRLLEQKEEVYFSAITETELLAGRSCSDPTTRETTLHLLSLFNKIHVDNPIAQSAGDLRRQYPILVPDAIVAASALFSNSTLITKNLKDFKMIEGLSVKSPY